MAMETITKKIPVWKKVFLRKSPWKVITGGLELLWGYPLYCLSFLVPRDRRKWVFGHKQGFADNAKYLYLYAQGQSEVRAYWITKDRKLLRRMRRLGLPAFHRYSPKGLFHSLTAHMYFYTTSPDAINFFTSGGSRLVNLWHGVGTKNFMTTNAGIIDDRLFCRIFAPWVPKKPDYVLVPTRSQRGYFQRFFSVEEDRLIDGIYPRCAFLRQGLPDIKEHIRRYEPEEVPRLIDAWNQYDRVYLYMPTWRAHLDAAYLDAAFPDLDRLDETLREANSLFVVKQHPTVKDGGAARRRDRVRFLDNRFDIYPLLPFTDVLITDYSSIYADYILMDGKGVVLYPFDLEEYQRNDLALMDYERDTPGRYARTFAELLRVIADREDCRVPGVESARRKWWGDYGRKGADDLWGKLRAAAGLGGPSPARERRI